MEIALALPMRSLYGQTENTGLATLNYNEDRLSNVGGPLRGVELKL